MKFPLVKIVRPRVWFENLSEITRLVMHSTLKGIILLSNFGKADFRNELHHGVKTRVVNKLNMFLAVHVSEVKTFKTKVFQFSWCYRSMISWF